MKSLEDKTEPEEIDEIDFQELITKNMSIFKGQANKSNNNYNQMINLYNQYLIDKQNYSLKFYVIDGMVYYDKIRKQKIGFKQNGKTTKNN